MVSTRVRAPAAPCRIVARSHTACWLALLWLALHPALQAQPGDQGQPNIIEQEWSAADLEAADTDPADGGANNYDAADDGAAAVALDDALDELSRYRAHPIVLQHATSQELARLPGLSAHRAREILAAFDRARPRNLKQLDSAADLSAEEFVLLERYTRMWHRARARRAPSLWCRVRATTELELRRGHVAPLLRSLTRLQGNDSAGIDTVPLGPQYLGSPAGLLVQAAAEGDRWRAGLIFEKDPGEPFAAFDTLQRSYRQYEHVDPRTPVEVVRRVGIFGGAYAAADVGGLTVHAGDYTARFGQGLVLWQGYASVKSHDPSGLHRAARGIAPHRSSSETGFLRGLAVTYHDTAGPRSRLSASAFGSVRWLDASMSISEDSVAAGAPASLRSDGMRRTHSELRNSGNLRETLLGAALQAERRDWDIGITLYRALYADLAGRDVKGPEGSGWMAGMNVRYAALGGTLFAEGALCEGGAGAVAGLMTALGAVDVTALGRWYSPTFASVHGSAFADAARAANERGLLLAVGFRPSRAVRLSAYVDLFASPERTARVPFPRTGSDALLRAEWSPMQRLKCAVQLRSRTTTEAETIEEPTGSDRRRMVDISTTRARLEAAYTAPDGAWSLRCRLERAVADFRGYHPVVDGFTTTFEARWAPESWPISAGVRATLFDTDGTRATIRLFELDLPERPMILALSGEGRRVSVQARWQSGAFRVAAFFSETAYADRTAIQPGTPREIRGSSVSAVGLQAEVTW